MLFSLLLLLLTPLPTSANCRHGCDLALASYYLNPTSDLTSNLNLNLTYIASLFNLPSPSPILPFNPQITTADNILAGSRIAVPFPCSCDPSTSRLSATFTYTTVPNDTYDVVAAERYANLTTADALGSVNEYSPYRIPDGAELNVTVECSCGDPTVSMEYGLFETYPLRDGEGVAAVAKEFGFGDGGRLIREYSGGGGDGRIVFVPTKGVHYTILCINYINLLTYRAIILHQPPK